MLIDQYFPYPTTEQAFFESLFPKKGADNFHRQWAADFSAARKNFYDVADQSKGGLNPVKETWKEAYKTFYAYLAKTFDFIDLMPRHAPSKLSLIFNSGFAPAQVGTVEDGNEVSCILEMMLSRWVYASTIYNNLLQDYHQLDSHQTFQGLQDSVNLFVRSLEDILVRLTRFEYCQKEIWERLPSRYQHFPELSQAFLAAFILLYEVMFCNALIFKNFILHTAVTKNLELNLEIIKLAERKLDPLNAAFSGLNIEFQVVVKKFTRMAKVLYDVSKLLSIYLLNKMQLDYPTYQKKTKKQIKYENHLLCNELHRQLNDKKVNEFGPLFDPMVRVLSKKIIFEAYEANKAYITLELPGLVEPQFLNTSLHHIVSQYDKYTDPDEDLVKINSMEKAGVALK